MKLRDILPDYPLNDIQVRINSPLGGDMFFGYCHWTGTELISGDGDSYDLDDEISKYEFSEDGSELTYWLIADWSRTFEDEDAE